jgi:hypothetical protein
MMAMSNCPGKITPRQAQRVEKALWQTLKHRCLVEDHIEEVNNAVCEELY